jgi:hypothetical protein
MHPLAMIAHLVFPRECASAALHAAITSINWAPKPYDYTVVLRSIVALEVGETAEGFGASAAVNIAFVSVMARDAVAQNVANDRWFGDGVVFVAGWSWCRALSQTSVRRTRSVVEIRIGRYTLVCRANTCVMGKVIDCKIRRRPNGWRLYLRSSGIVQLSVTPALNAWKGRLGKGTRNPKCTENGLAKFDRKVCKSPQAPIEVPR